MANPTFLQATSIKMPNSAIWQLTAGFLLLSTLYGCGSLSVQDGAPTKTMDWDSIPDAVPQTEPLSDKGNPDSYSVNGQRYNVNFDTRNFSQQGLASWYGTKFHGKLTSSGEPYDMYKMTAAHKTLPIPCYVRVTNLQTGKKIVVKVNDRGPFVDGRIIDLSYAAAKKLGITQTGTARVQLDLVTPDTPDVVVYAAAASPAPVTATPVTVTPITATPIADTPNATAEVPITQVSATQIPTNQAGTSDGNETQDESISDSTDEQRQVATVESPQSNDAAEMTANANNYYVQIAAFSQRNLAENFRQQLQDLNIVPIKITTLHKADNKIYRVRVGPFSDKQQVQTIETRLTELGYTHSLLIIE